jgi:hypothetical protein
MVLHFHFSFSIAASYFITWPFQQLNACMKSFLSFVITIVCVTATSRIGAQDCEINFDLFGLDTLCTSNGPFVLPPVLPFGGTYSGPNVLGDVFNPGGLEPGQYVLTYSVNTPECVASDDVIMTIIEAEGVSIVGDFEICPGDTTMISAEPSIELTWYDGQKSFFRNFILDTTLTSTASGIDLLGCSFSQEFTIEVNGLPEDVAITGNNVNCPGDELTLSVNIEDNFVWFNESSEPSITFQVFESSEYSLYIEISDECDTTLSYFVEIVPLPEPVIQANTAICAGDSVVITFSGADFFKDQFGTIISPYVVFPLDDFTYFIEAYNSVECFVTTPVEIIVNEFPVIELSGLDEICAGENLLIEADGGEYYTWFDLDSGLDITQFADSIYFGIPSDTLRVELTAHTFAECNTVLALEVPVNPIPQPAIEVINPFCDGEIVTLLASGADSFTWSTGVQDSLLEFIGADDFMLTLYASNATGCEDSLTLDVVIHPVPVVTGTGVVSFCEGLSTELVGNGADYYIWNGVFEGDTLITAPIQDTIINLVGFTEFGCSDFTNLIINVDPAPVVSIIADDQICIGESVQLSVESNGAVIWSDGSTQLEFFLTPLADTTLSLVSTANNGCIREIDFPIAVHPLPVVLIAGNNNVCAGEQITLTASGAAQYVWNTNQTTGEILITPFSDFDYEVVGTSAAGCVSSLQFALTVHPAPYAFFEFSEEAVCDYGPGLSWIANPAGGVLSGDGVVNNSFNPMDAIVGLNTVTYTVTNEFNCSASALDQVLVDDCSAVADELVFSHNVYPNPAADLVFLEVNRPSQVLLMNAIGEIVADLNVALIGYIDVSELASGFYFIKFKPDLGTEETVKLIVH